MENKIKELLAEKNISQKQFAAILNIAPSTLNGYLKGKRAPDYQTLLSIADYFNVSCDYLLGGRCSQTLTTEEKSILKTYNKLTNEKKRIFIDILNVLNKK